MNSQICGRLSSQCKSCSWEKDFSTRQNLDFRNEDKPFIGSQLYSPIEGTEEDDDENQDTDPDDGDDDLSDNGADTCLDDETVVKYFLGELGEDGSPQYLDLFEKIGGFCKETRLTHLQNGTTENNGAPVAILHELSSARHSRPYKGPLTQKTLYEYLSRKRFGAPSDGEVSSSRDKYTAQHLAESDTEKRLIYVTNLDRWSILALFATASRSQRPALIDLVYQHLDFRASMGVISQTSWPCAFNMNLHIPYFALRKHSKMASDPRKKSDGTPLRTILDLPSVQSPETSPTPLHEAECLYQAKVSFAVTGIDHRSWVAYAFVDAIERLDTVEHYDREARELGTPSDPLACGQVAVEAKFLPPPKQYFLKVFHFRILKVKYEWEHIVHRLQTEVKRVGGNAMGFALPKDSQGQERRTQARDLNDWTTKMTFIMTELIGCLDSTIRKWENFMRRDIQYFVHHCESPSNGGDVDSRFDWIDRIFDELRDFREELDKAKGVLSDSFSNALNRRLSLENNDAAVFQQRIAKYIANITVCFYPLILAANLFSTQPGVMPFPQTFPSFALSFIAFALLVLLAFKWDSWSRTISSLSKIEMPSLMLNLRPKKQEPEAEGQNIAQSKKEMRGGIASPSILKRKLFPSQGRVDQIPLEDVEAGTAAGNL